MGFKKKNVPGKERYIDFFVGRHALKISSSPFSVVSPVLSCSHKKCDHDSGFLCLICSSFWAYGQRSTIFCWDWDWAMIERNFLLLSQGHAIGNFSTWNWFWESSLFRSRRTHLQNGIKELQRKVNFCDNKEQGICRGSTSYRNHCLILNFASASLFWNLAICHSHGTD